MAKEEQIKTSIDLTGEKEYRAACTNINSSLREIGSEMKLTTAEFADNADSVEALTAKQKLLQKQFDEQAKKAEAAEKALKKMRDNGIEPTNPAYQKMQTNLNNTKADMVKIQKEIDGTSKKLKSSKVDWESVGETVGKAGKAIGAACAAMGAAIAARVRHSSGLPKKHAKPAKTWVNLKPASRRRDIRQRTRKTPIRSCTAFLATTDRQRKPPPTLRS